ncbi:MAG: HlyD family efflux transporter periplasmic adaptor subunit [Actinomycetes bacterium]
MSTLFRQRAVAGRSSAETLDDQVRIVRLPVWSALGLAVLLLAGFLVWLSVGTVAISTKGAGVVTNAPTNSLVSATSSGNLITAAPPVGTMVRVGDVVAQIMEQGEPSTVTKVLAPVSGTIVGVGAGSNVVVDYGQYLATIAPDTAEQFGYLFIPDQAGESVRPGMSALLAPDSVNTTSEGLLEGTVVYVSPLPVDESRIAYITADKQYTKELMQQGPLVEVKIAPVPDPTTPTGWRWTRPPGPSQPLVSGMPTMGTIVLAQVPPYQAFFGRS